MSRPKSYTAWSIYNKCGAQYKYRYIERIKDTRPKNEAAVRGTSIHEQVEGILNNTPTEFKPDSPVIPYIEFFEDLREEGAQAEVKFLIDHDWKPLPTDQKEGMATGYIDVYLPYPSERTLYIYELKTGREYDDHVSQRQFYGTMGLVVDQEEQFDKAVVTGVYLDSMKNVENTYERDMLPTYKYFWDGKFEAMDNPATYVPAPGWHCKWCPYSADKGGPCKFSGD